MNISELEVIYGVYKFKRSEVKGFRRDGERLIFIIGSAKLEVDVGVQTEEWPFDIGPLVFDGYYFLPEHVLGFYDSKDNVECIDVWTEVGKFSPKRNHSESYSTVAKKNMANSLAQDWIDAYKSKVQYC
jgi:hypothetical protein